MPGGKFQLGGNSTALPPLERPVLDEVALRELCDEKFGLGTECVLMGWRGSVAHGTYVPSTEEDSYDDRDLMGIAVPPAEYTLGLREMGSRGTVEVARDPWDVVVYDYRKALRLLAKGNPNVLALLWMPEEMYLWGHEGGPGKLLLDNRKLFSSKACYPAFRGYAQSQAKKMKNPGEYRGYMGKKRRELVDRFGYDVKNASHAVRILRQGIDFLRTGEMEVKRRDAAELVKIKRGEWDLEFVQMELAECERELEYALEQSPLPEEVDMDDVNRLAVHMAELRYCVEVPGEHV